MIIRTRQQIVKAITMPNKRRSNSGKKLGRPKYDEKYKSSAKKTKTGVANSVQK